MKRVYKSAQEPEALKKYRTLHPEGTWERFRHRSESYRQVKRQILQDQHGLCAYCEISIKLAEEAGEVDDFRVEHFFPKGATKKHGHNYHLDWRNLLGVCHGGSQPGVPDPDWRFSKRKRDRSCDVPKGGKEITDIILNPLKIPGNVRLFRYAEHNGRMYVDEETCPKRLQRKAKSTIRELNLNAPRLMRMRLEVIATLEDAIAEAVGQGQELEEAVEMLAESSLLPGPNGQCLPFFSVIRWFLGEAADKVIRSRDKYF